ncbi:MAG: hypothetical protein ACLVCE_00510 [Anaerovoracaceae bacterium]
MKDIVKIFTEQTLTTKNLSAAENRVSIDSGGYMVLGNWVFVQITLKIKVTLNGNTYWTLMDGFPEPKTPFAALGANYHFMDAPVNVSLYGSALTITCGNQELQPGRMLVISGFYIKA